VTSKLEDASLGLAGRICIDEQVEHTPSEVDWTDWVNEELLELESRLAQAIHRREKMASANAEAATLELTLLDTTMSRLRLQIHMLQAKVSALKLKDAKASSSKK